MKTKNKPVRMRLQISAFGMVRKGCGLRRRVRLPRVEPNSPPPGYSDRDIARALFITTNTVEIHLTTTYDKLGITSRADAELRSGL